MTIQEKIISSLKEKKLTLALAESVTGGYVSAMLTGVPGASQVFLFGAVVYTLQAKHRLLGLPVKELEKCEGVSAATADALAENIRSYSKSDIGASIVGFAGPQAPAGKTGLIYLSVSSSSGVRSEEKRFRGSRGRIRMNAANALLKMIDRQLRT